MDNIENAVICDKCGEFVIPEDGKCPVCGKEIDFSKVVDDFSFEGEDTIDEDFDFGGDDEGDVEFSDELDVDFVPSDDDIELDLGDDEFVGDDIDFSGLDDIDFGDDSEVNGESSSSDEASDPDDEEIDF